MTIIPRRFSQRHESTAAIRNWLYRFVIDYVAIWQSNREINLTLYNTCRGGYGARPRPIHER